MALSRMHTSAKAIDTAKFLLVNKCQMKHMVRWRCVTAHDTDVWLDPVGYNVDPYPNHNLSTNLPALDINYYA